MGTRRTAVVALAIPLAIAVSVVLVRAVTPYYMAFVILTLVLGLAALGLRSAMARSPGSAISRVQWPSASRSCRLCGGRRGENLLHGLYPFAVWPLFDIRRPYQEGPPLPFVPAYAMAAIGDALCANRTVVAHGTLAFHLLHNYGLETKLQCAAPPAMRLGGAEPSGAAHVAGLSRSVLRGAQNDQDSADPIAEAGPMSLLPVRRIVNPISGESTAPPGTYPPTRYTLGAPHRLALQFDARCDEIVVVTNMYYWFATDPTIVAVLNGNTVQPAAADALSAAYICKDAAPESTASWQLQIASPSPERVDVITVVPAKH